MLDISHLPTGYGSSDVQEFFGKSTAVLPYWETWIKPRGKTMCSILLIGKGGNGGNGAIGANSTAAGGGGGGSGGQVFLTLPLAAIPDQLYLSLAGNSAYTTLASYVSIFPTYVAGGAAPTANHVLALASGGGNGGNASGATGGTAGTAAGVVTATGMPLGWIWASLALAGQAGVTGSSVSAGGAVTLPTTGLIVTGGASGAGLSSAGLAGLAGGGINPAGGLGFPPSTGPAGGATATTPPNRGSDGFQAIRGLDYYYGGTGGGTTHGSATGAGLVQSSGGNGAWGCGGGGSGGALTGSTAGTAGQGGPAYCLIVCW